MDCEDRMVLCVRFSNNWLKKMKFMQSATRDEIMTAAVAMVTIFWAMERFMRTP
jgi:hypothetical protein